MAIRNFRLNVKAAHFPLLSSYMGRSVAMRSPDDSDYVVTDSYTGTSANDEIGLGQPIYMHNVMPVSHGLQSVGYKVELDNSDNSKVDFDQALILRSRNETRHILVPARGANYININGTTWSDTSSPGDIKLGGFVTRAYVGQRTFVCYQQQGIFEYDSDSHLLRPITLTGATDSEFAGICSSNNFLLAFTSDTIFYSSIIDPLDFVPDLSTGAGSSKITFLRGAIVAVLPIHNGFVLYSTVNAVSAYWTGELSSPWVFREIPSSAGIVSPEHVSADSNYGNHFAWTTSGFMQIGKEAAVINAPEVTDYLTCGRLEDYIGEINSAGQGTEDLVADCMAAEKQLNFNSDPNGLKNYSYEGQLKIKLAFIGTRYLAISYGINNKLTHILVSDLALKRWGKLRIAHTDVFEYQNPAVEGRFDVKESFGILQANGTIQSVDFRLSTRATDSILMFGRIQHSRANMTTLYATELTGIIYKNTQVRWIPSFDGSTLLPEYGPVCIMHNDNMIKSAGRFTAANFVLKVTGGFSIATIQCQVESASGNR